jgi:hypothetical protein
VAGRESSHAPRSRRLRCNLKASCAKEKARKSKQMKEKLLSFAFIFFSESGLFKGLRAEKILKAGAVSTRL